VVLASEEASADSPENIENGYRDEVRPDDSEHVQHLVDTQCKRVIEKRSQGTCCNRHNSLIATSESPSTNDDPNESYYTVKN